MDNNKAYEIIKKLISSCRELELMELELYKIGFSIDSGAILYAKDQLMDCVSTILEVDRDDMISDEVVRIMMNSELSEEQILERLIETFGSEGLEE